MKNSSSGEGDIYDGHHCDSISDDDSDNAKRMSSKKIVCDDIENHDDLIMTN